VIIRDINLSCSADEFVKEFAKYYVSSLIDFFSGYDQIKLDVYNRDLILFHISLRLLRITILPQDVTNSVA